jgi:hypothetical protein
MSRTTASTGTLTACLAFPWTTYTTAHLTERTRSDTVRCGHRTAPHRTAPHCPLECRTLMPCRADETSWAHCCAAQRGMLLCGPSAPLALARWADLQLQHAIDRRLGCAVRFARRCMTTALQRLVLDKTPRPGHPKTDGPASLASLGFGARTASQCLSARASVAASRRTGGRSGIAHRQRLNRVLLRRRAPSFWRCLRASFASLSA